ncbi:MAG: HAD family phosphatase [Methylotenera sp.]|nr:HAD family phosphatase [Oligoflexia bacterium]
MKLELPAHPEKGSFKAYLFDCDGTIANSMPIHYRAWMKALDRWNCPFPEKDFYDWAGMPTPAIVERLNERQGLAMSHQEISDIKEKAYFELLPEVKPVPEVLEQIHLQHSRLPLAVVSGSPRDSVIRTLSALGLMNYFDVILGAEDYPRGKPHPDAYLLAAKRLKVNPADCLVFEDAELGIESARRAKMAWVKVIPDRL